MSQSSRQTDNHKAENGFIPANCWGEDVFIDEKLVEKNLLGIKNKIAPCKPRIIGVTKYFGLNAIKSGYNAGVRDFAESRAVEAVRKLEQLPDEICKNSEFHFIGHLQTNKVQKVVEYFDYIHSVDSLKLAKIISKTACSLNKREKVLLQVNVAQEEQKFGYDKKLLQEDLGEILELPNLDVVGLMCMAPLGASENVLRKIFSEMRELREFCERKFSTTLPELSMGMSDDYHIAVEEGATMIRIGRKLFI